eukprot:GHVS01053129.1.p1 GENE.GHVS01053129.1~~GHVS01053129.1.p1  ORF type:complete len:107 (+),score=6.81 GHVS01053129.1:1073-1393(+)
MLLLLLYVQILCVYVQTYVDKLCVGCSPASFSVSSLKIRRQPKSGSGSTSSSSLPLLSSRTQREEPDSLLLELTQPIPNSYAYTAPTHQSAAHRNLYDLNSCYSKQ